ncbi:hypothetical protein N0V85_008000 [Neurospora sp. IMI 360204]|nr:hypothetical protein N0V85_008000 [Neurospora sp. IMI 360204]
MTTAARLEAQRKNQPFEPQSSALSWDDSGAAQTRLACSNQAMTSLEILHGGQGILCLWLREGGTRKTLKEEKTRPLILF